jgi:hypothetical protein
MEVSGVAGAAGVIDRKMSGAPSHDKRLDAAGDERAG